MTQRKPTIQRVELLTDGHAIYCPFCGTKAMAAGDGDDIVSKFCEHVLFMAHDAGFEYRSERFDALMKITGTDSDDIDLGDNGYDSYTDSVPLEGSVKFASYQGAPSFFGAYVGFAPVGGA